MTTTVATMAAVLVAPPRGTRVTRVRVPEPGALDALVRIEGCGVCASSLPAWEGRPWFSYPLEPGAPGHEGWGIVERIGAQVEEPAPGTRVCLLSQHAFAEYDVALAAHCVPIDTALPGEPLACALNVVRKAGVHAGDRVAVIGVGFLGSLVAMLCERAGAVVAPVRRGDDVDGPFECVIECAGTQSALDVASRLVAERGRLVLAGFHQDGPRIVDMCSWNWRGIDVVNAHERDPAVSAAAMREAVDLGTDVTSLLTHRFTLDRLDEAFAAARTRPEGFVKAWVEP
jgi:threonine dehydrogenase-like Zn-dependent dehydrogenase